MIATEIFSKQYQPRKVVMFLLSCNINHFLKIEQKLRETCYKDIFTGKYPNIEVYFYRASEDGETHYDEKTHVISVPTTDALFDTFKKFELAWQWFQSTHDISQYNFVYRGNLSTWINIPIFDRFVGRIQDMNMTFCGNVFKYFKTTMPILEGTSVLFPLNKFLEYMATGYNNISVEGSDDYHMSYKFFSYWELQNKNPFKHFAAYGIHYSNATEEDLLLTERVGEIPNYFSYMGVQLKTQHLDEKIVSQEKYKDGSPLTYDGDFYDSRSNEYKMFDNLQKYYEEHVKDWQAKYLDVLVNNIIASGESSYYDFDQCHMKKQNENLWTLIHKEYGNFCNKAQFARIFGVYDVEKDEFLQSRRVKDIGLAYVCSEEDHLKLVPILCQKFVPFVKKILVYIFKCQYTEEEYNTFMQQINQVAGSKAQIIINDVHDRDIKEEDLINAENYSAEMLDRIYDCAYHSIWAGADDMNIFSYLKLINDMDIMDIDTEEKCEAFYGSYITKNDQKQEETKFAAILEKACYRFVANPEAEQIIQNRCLNVPKHYYSSSYPLVRMHLIN